MPLDIEAPDDATRRIQLRDVAALRAPTLARSERVRHLVVQEVNGVSELPCGDAEIAARTVSLQPLLDAYPSLRTLRIEAHVYSPRLSHATVERVSLVGAIGFTPLAMPALTELALEVSGDEAGCANPFAPFAWLLEAAELPRLEWLDLRHLTVELERRTPSFIDRWANAPVLARLRLLGLPGEEIGLARLKKVRASFAHLQHLVIHDLIAADGDPISAVAKNPVGGNVILESELGEVPLDRVADEVAALPRLDHLKPAMTDAELEAVCARLLSSSVRYPASVFVKVLRPFCKQRQWERLELLLRLAKQKVPYRRAFMDLREAMEALLADALAARPDPAGERLRDRLHEQNQL
jgi:hypothetical protein